MTLGGWLLLITSLTVVYGVAIWCYVQVLGAPPPDHHEH